jgi:hypothetical protein
MSCATTDTADLLWVRRLRDCVDGALIPSMLGVERRMPFHASYRPWNRLKAWLGRQWGHLRKRSRKR